MTIGSGIAIAAIWMAGAAIVKDERVTGFGMVLALIAAVYATGFVAGIKL